MRGVPETDELSVFKSLDHPGTGSQIVTYTHASAVPILYASIPVMLGALTSVLLEQDPLYFVYWAAPVAIGSAIAWTHFHLQYRIAEIYVYEQYAAVRSVWDVVYGRDLSWYPVFGAEQTPKGFRVSIGDRVYELRGDNWPQSEILLAKLHDAVER